MSVNPVCEQREELERELLGVLWSEETDMLARETPLGLAVADDKDARQAGLLGCVFRLFRGHGGQSRGW